MFPQLIIDTIETIASGLLVNVMVHIQLLSRCIVSILVYLAILRRSKSHSLHNIVAYIYQVLILYGVVVKSVARVRQVTGGKRTGCRLTSMHCNTTRTLQSEQSWMAVL